MVKIGKFRIPERGATAPLAPAYADAHVVTVNDRRKETELALNVFYIFDFG